MDFLTPAVTTPTIGGMQRLSGLDASFLYLETAKQPLHVCSVLELDTATMPGGYTFDRLRDALALRIKAMPQFREKLADSPFNLDHPVWVDDKDFDVDRHLHRIGLPSPGGRHELAEICGHIASLPLDRSKPLWETWVIENVAGTDAHADAGGRLAVMTKVHHAGVDGVTGANLMSQLCSTEPDAPAPDPVDGVGGASGLEIALSGAVKYATRPLKLLNVLPTTVSTVVDTVKRARSGLTMAAPFAAPKTAFNANLTGHRNIAFTQLDLEDIKTVKNHFGVKVNDVVMALVSGVLRKFLARPRRIARQHVGGDGSGVGAREVRPARPESGVGHVLPAGDPHRGPSRTPEVDRGGEFRCQTAQFGDRCDSASGLVAVRRARGVRCGDARLCRQQADRPPNRCTTW